jgi:hypothetical protein
VKKGPLEKGKIDNFPLAERQETMSGSVSNLPSPQDEDQEDDDAALVVDEEEAPLLPPSPRYRPDYDDRGLKD